MSDPAITTAEFCLSTRDFAADLAFFTKQLGFRLDTIFPADDPAVAVLSGYGVRLRLDRGADAPPGVLRLLCEDPGQDLTAPNGTRILMVPAETPMIQPETQHAFVVRRLRDKAPWVTGRAGMHYRDLIPDRLGGSIIASHIRIPDGGPVPDMVHYHTIGFQLIYCYRGWVDLVYEDQGPPFRLSAGDCVIQPPEIRHRVLVASDSVEVVEIGVPAEHVTTIDHDMTLPTPTLNPDRVFGGQRFCRHRVKDAVWSPWRLPGFRHRDTGILDATGAVASVQVAAADRSHSPAWSHDTDILFTFVLEGTMTLHGAEQDPTGLTPGDAFVVPPGMIVQYRDCSSDLELLEVSLPGAFATARHPDL